MRSYQQGDSGEPILDIQGRLAALGYSTEPDEPGEFGPGSRAAVVSFQQARGLTPTGLVDASCWGELVEAGYRLGDRLLYIRRPMLRGDDVAELQRRLNALGFDAGKVDGIFGPDTERALQDFQQNRRMAEDGMAGPKVVAELRLIARATRKTGREAVREREWLRRLPPSIVSRRVYLDPACRDSDEASAAWEASSSAAASLQEMGAYPLVSRSIDVDVPVRARARRANRLGADVVVAFQLSGDEDPLVMFFASALSRSEAGARLAAEIAAPLELPTGGRAAVILKETRAPAVLISAPVLDAKLGRSAAQGVRSFFETGDREDGTLSPPETAGRSVPAPPAS